MDQNSDAAIEAVGESVGESVIEVALALLVEPGQPAGQGPRFLMQLRDDEPSIIYPGCWGLFGGHLEAGETPEAGLRRELAEEIGYVPPVLTAFRREEAPLEDFYQGQNRAQASAQRTGQTTTIVRHFFWGEVAIALENLQLNEGQDLAWISLAELKAGQGYSPRLGQTRELGRPHRAVLLDFALMLP